MLWGTVSEKVGSIAREYGTDLRYSDSTSFWSPERRADMTFSNKRKDYSLSQGSKAEAYQRRMCSGDTG